MTAQAQNHKEFFKKLFGEKSSVEFGDDDTTVTKVWNSGEPFFIEIDLERSDLTFKKLSQIIQNEFELNEDISFVIKKRSDVLIRNDKDVNPFPTDLIFKIFWKYPVDRQKCKKSTVCFSQKYISLKS